MPETTVLPVVQQLPELSAPGRHLVAPERRAVTVVPARVSAPTAPGAPQPAEARREPRGTGVLERLDLAGAFVGACSVSLLLFGRIAPLSGGLGFVVVTYLVFLVLYGTLVSLRDDRVAVRDRIWTVLLGSAAGLLFAGLGFLVIFALWRGRIALLHSNFFTQDLHETGPLSALDSGGLRHAVVGTLEMIAIALVITVPLGLLCAVYLTQIGGRGSRLVRTVVEAMTALPSIVAGLFIFASWILILGFERSGLAAALALSVMMLPIIIRSADVVLRLVPGTLREASEALGAPRWRTIWHVVLPTARPGLATAVILGTARGIGETSPVLLTAGYTTYVNSNPVHGPMTSLPLAVFELVKSPQPAFIARGFAAAALLMAIVLALFVLARLIGGRGPGHVSRRQARRTAIGSLRTAARMSAPEQRPATDEERTP